MKVFLFPTLLVLHNGVSASMNSVLSVHGSGTTNPGMCVRSIMEELEARSKLPLRMTYRGIGSSLGLEEFINGFNDTKPLIDFEMSEIPISSDDWQKFQEKEVEVLQLPTFFGGVSFFYNVPNLGNLNLTSCLLARIFNTEIKDWAHPDIRAINPGYDEWIKNQDSLVYQRIRVAVRELGSSSALAITEYLHQSCPEHFSEDMVGSMPKWSLNTLACRGTTGMAKCIEDTEGMIGFLDSGVGIRSGFQEVAIKNKFGTQLTSQEALSHGGIGVLEEGTMPSDPRADFSAVSVLDQNGRYAWPITLVTYTHVRVDLSFMENPAERSLLVAFIKALYDPQFTDICKTNYGFELAKGPALKLGQIGIELLEENVGSNVTTWVFEEKPTAYVGAGDYVFSATRRNFPAWERATSLQMIEALRQSNVALQAQLNELSAKLAEYVEEDGPEYNEAEEAKIMASLVLASLSMVVLIAMMAMSCISVHNTMKK